MVRISLIATLIICISISVSIQTANGQEMEVIDDIATATIRGEVIEATPELKPIPGVTVTIVNSSTGETYIVTTNKDGAFEKTGLLPGRYTIAVDKNGYGSRVGKSRVVAAGGEIFTPIKMIKKDTIVTFFQKHFFTWQSLIIFAIIFFIVLILSSRRSRG